MIYAFIKFKADPTGYQNGDDEKTKTKDIRIGQKLTVPLLYMIL